MACVGHGTAVVSLKVEDYLPFLKRWWLRLREKGGKVNEMGCHHKLEHYLDENIAAAGIAEDKKVRSSARPSAGRARGPSGPCRVSMHGAGCARARDALLRTFAFETLVPGTGALHRYFQEAAIVDGAHGAPLADWPSVHPEAS
jgi:hypothetical protein